MGLDAYFYTADRDKLEISKKSGLIKPNYFALRNLAHFRKFYELSEFIRDIWEHTDGADLPPDSFNGVYMLLESHDIEALEEFAKDYYYDDDGDDIDTDKVELLAVLAICRVAMDDGKCIIYSNDW